MVLLPHVGHHVQPLAGAGVPVVVLLEVQAVLGSLVAPPARYHVERQAARRNQVDVGRLFGQLRGVVKRGAHGHHYFQLLGHGGQRGGRAPGFHRWGLRAFNVVEVQFRNQREVVAPGLRCAGPAASRSSSRWAFARLPRCAASPQKRASNIQISWFYGSSRNVMLSLSKHLYLGEKPTSLQRSGKMLRTQHDGLFSF